MDVLLLITIWQICGWIMNNLYATSSQAITFANHPAPVILIMTYGPLTGKRHFAFFSVTKIPWLFFVCLVQCPIEGKFSWYLYLCILITCSCTCVCTTVSFPSWLMWPNLVWPLLLTCQLGLSWGGFPFAINHFHFCWKLVILGMSWRWVGGRVSLEMHKFLSHLICTNFQNLDSIYPHSALKQWVILGTF